MKRFLFIPTCALVALGALTSCQKEEMSAAQLAEELTAELQKVTSYKTAEAAAPRVEALNKRYQNASVRVFSMGGNALVNSDAAAYSDATCRLARQIGRVRASKPVSEYDGEVVDSLLVRTVGTNSGAAADATPQEQVEAGAKYIYNAEDQNANNPPNFAECYGSAKLKAALDYVASPSEFPMTRFDKPEDCPEIPESASVEAEEEVTIPVPADDREAAAEEEGGEEATEETSDDSADVSTDDATEETTDEETTEEETTDDGDDDLSLDVDTDDVGTEETTEETTDESTEEETTDDSSEDAGDDMLDIEI